MRLDPDFVDVSYYTDHTDSEDERSHPREIKLSKKERRAKKRTEKKLKRQQKLDERKAKIEKKADKKNRKQRKEMEDILVDYHVADSLMPDEKDFYKKVGKIKEGQDYLEIFTDDLIHDIRSIMNATFRSKSSMCISGNHNKAKMLMEELGSAGFKQVGLGTNIIVFRHKMYPGVVYKIALDRYGIDDNINDEWLYNKHPDMYARFICRHPTGLVSVQEAYATILSKERMQDFIGQAYDMVTRLERNYVIVDLSPVNYKNFAVTRDGRLIIIDGSDLIPIPKGMDLLRCKNVVGSKKDKLIRCGSKLHYTADYNRLECPVCGQEFMPIDMKPRFTITEEQRMILVNSGLTKKEQKELDKYVDELIAEAGFTVPDEEPEAKETSGKKSKTPTLDFPDIHFDSEEHKREVMQQVDELTSSMGWKNPFAPNDEDEFASDEDDDLDDEDLPEGEPPEENYEGPEGSGDNTDGDGYMTIEELSIRNKERLRQKLLYPEHEDTEDDDDLEDTTDKEISSDVTVVDVQSNTNSEGKVDIPASVTRLSAYDTSMGEGDQEKEISVFTGSTGDASTEVEFSDDPCAVNVMITGDIKEAFEENGPSVYIAMSDDPENWIEIMPPTLFGEIVKQLVDKRNDMLKQFRP